ncbi:unnamed protein product [Cylicostephanus goldi]|uniref:Uncharacterized protein n=1 Tax=Cylicostephanus goldi TaxID=71465 RepID=A0A3P7MPA3_CYLGO|nr:unnamed protein product [Cylicostephanus goldi]
MQVLDLSYNFLQTVPFELPCPFPSLTSLDLRQNFLKTLTVNASCLSNVRSLDLSRDANDIIKVEWCMPRLLSKIRDKHSLVCDRASPRNYVGARLVEVPLHKLDCSENLFAMSSSHYSLFVALVVLLASFLL